MDKARAHVWVEGDVQGVFYRSECREEALRNGVTGWVKNLPDGRVEAAFEGDRSDVQRMVDWCGRGPERATVERAHVAWEPPTHTDPEFRVIK